MASRFFKWLPLLCVSLGISAGAQVSPQQKIVTKYRLEQRISDARDEDFLMGNRGCRQPSNSKEEKVLYRDFRLVARRANIPDALLLVCDAVEGFPVGTENIYSNTSAKIVRTTKGLARTPKATRRSLLGHELTHIFNEDDEVNPGKEVAAYVQFEIEAQAILRPRGVGGILLTLDDLSRLLRQEVFLRGQALQAITNAASSNHPMEGNADVGGLILAAGKGCHIDTLPLTSGIKGIYDTMPAWVSEGTYSHPAFEERRNYLKSNKAEIEEACRTYYTQTKKHRFNKTPKAP